MSHDALPENRTEVLIPRDSRRGFLSRASGWLMGLGLLGGYGAFAAYAIRFLYPSRPDPRAWLFVARLAEMAPDQAVPYTSPAGDPVLITRRGEGAAPDDFIALSSTCPHLGCKVHWEPGPGHFFCPCHNGTFNTSGIATSGPPAAAGQSLPRYELKVENGLLFINVPLRANPIGSQQTA